MPPPYIPLLAIMTLLRMRGDPSPHRIPPPPPLVNPVTLIASLLTIRLFRIIGEERGARTPPPSRYVPGLCSSFHAVPLPPVMVNPCRTAVESSPLMISTQLAVSACTGALPLIIVDEMKPTSPLS